jgi:hypothetical protein
MAARRRRRHGPSMRENVEEDHVSRVGNAAAVAQVRIQGNPGLCLSLAFGANINASA